MRHRPSALAPLAAAACWACLVPPAPAQLPTPEEVWHEKPVKVGLRKQLLVDDHVVSQTENLTRELGRAARANGGKPVLVPDRPWENDYFGSFVTVLHDGKKFRMWYCAFNYCAGYAESEDGLRWSKPELGLFDFDPEKIKDGDEFGRGAGFFPLSGTKPVPFKGTKNNIIGKFGQGMTIFRDPNESDPAHRYKACYGVEGSKVKWAAALAHSPDGLRDWKPYNGGEPVTGRASDTVNQMLWDPGAKVYRLYTRHDFGTAGGPLEKRGNRGMTNPDVKADPTNWKTVRAWQFDREGPEEYKRRQIMTLTSWIHEGVNFALIGVYEWPTYPPKGLAGPVEGLARPERDVVNFYVATCRGDDNWDLTWVYAGKPLLPRGPAGSFDRGLIWPPTTVVTWQDKHWLYYGGWPGQHWNFPQPPGIGLATLRLDGFVFLGPQVKAEPGWLITRPFRLDGPRLEVNADAAGGWLAVEVLDEGGRPVPGFALDDCRRLEKADGPRLAVRWQKHDDLSSLAGRVVRLKIHVHDARLYAFQVRP
jgi:hypothetical protein